MTRYFSSGATRDTDDNKLDYEGFSHPLIEWRYAQYMHRHRIQSDGELRDGDNWQKGFPEDVIMKSLHRHFMDVWLLYRGVDVVDEKGEKVPLEDALCGLRFNVNAYLHSLLDDKEVNRGYGDNSMDI